MKIRIDVIENGTVVIARSAQVTEEGDVTREFHLAVEEFREKTGRGLFDPGVIVKVHH